MEPGLGQNRGDVRRGINILSARKRIACAKGGELFSVPLIDASKSAELTLNTIVKTVVVGIARDKAVSADAIVGLNALDHMDGKRKACYPWMAGHLVGE